MWISLHKIRILGLKLNAYSKRCKQVDSTWNEEYEMTLVKEYMNKNFASIDSKASILETSKKMVEENMGYLIVLKRGMPAGIATEKDLIVKVMAAGKDPKDVEVSQVMSSPLVTIDPDENLEAAVELMKKHHFRRLPVVKGNIIYGVFTARDLVEHFDEVEDQLTRDIFRFFPY